MVEEVAHTLTLESALIPSYVKKRIQFSIKVGNQRLVSSLGHAG